MLPRGVPTFSQWDPAFPLPQCRLACYLARCPHLASGTGPSRFSRNFGHLLSHEALAHIERDPFSAAFSLQPELCPFAISRGSSLTLSATLSRPPSRFSRNSGHLLSHEALAHIERDPFSAAFSLQPELCPFAISRGSSLTLSATLSRPSSRFRRALPVCPFGRLPRLMLGSRSNLERPLNSVGHEVPSTPSMHCDMRKWWVPKAGHHMARTSDQQW